MDYLVIGHVTRDLTAYGWSVGGTVTYAGRAAKALGARVRAVTRTDEETLAELSGMYLEVACVPVPQATTFHNVEGERGREQWMYALAPSVGSQDVPQGWGSSGVVHVGPVAGECNADLAQSFPPGTFLGITPQGWHRGCDGKGRVFRTPWRDSSVWLPRADAVVLSDEDIEHDWHLAEEYASKTGTLVITQGADGCTVFTGGRPSEYEAPARYPRTFATGSGDVFAAVFFLARASGMPTGNAAQAANCLAGRSVAGGSLHCLDARDIKACGSVAKQLVTAVAEPASEGPSAVRMDAA